MKLASLRSGRDGRLVVVSRDLSRAALAPVATLQAALDAWEMHLPALTSLAAALERGEVDHFPFDPAACAAPLPRAFQWLDASAYVNHVELVRRSRGEPLPDWYGHDPLMYQGGSDVLLGARDAIRLADPAWGIDLEGEIAVITGDVDAGASLAEAAASIRLLMLVNDVSLRAMIPGELAKGFGFVRSKPASGFSPVAVTPDELGSAWDGRRVDLPLNVEVNGVPLGRVEAGPEMTFDFPELIRHATKTRALGAGTILGSGTVSNRAADGSEGLPVADGGRGYACISEQRMVETLRGGAPVTPWLVEGDRVRIEMTDRDGHSVFGAIEQQVELAPQPAYLH